MTIQFQKYQGTGNDFIIIDNRDMKFSQSDNALASRLCNRKFGIGADGLILLQNKQGYDFEMVYFNSDGNESSMCGNGGRCITEYARTIGLVKDKAVFYAIDGMHEAKVKPSYVSLKMKDVTEVEITAPFAFLNTGSPHYVAFVSNIEKYDVEGEGKKIRNSSRFVEHGVNVNFAEKKYNELFVRTYERGVEGETLSCGTGVTAAALVAALRAVSTTQTECDVITLGGKLKVKFVKNNDNTFTDIWLEGPATFVFKGEIEI